MKFTVDKREKYLTFKLDEEKLDSLIAPAVKAEMVKLNTAEGYRNIIFNMSTVKFVDSSGLSSVLIGNRLCKESGGTFVLTHVNENVGKLIKISQLDSILAILPTDSEATDYILMEEVQRELNDEDE